MKKKFKLTIPRALLLSTILHVGGVTLLTGINSCEDKPKTFEVELVQLEECQGGEGQGEGDQKGAESAKVGSQDKEMVKIETNLEGYLEKNVTHPRDAYFLDIPKSYISREHHYERMLSEDPFRGLAYLDDPIPIQPIEKEPSVTLYREGFELDQVKQGGYKGPKLKLTDSEMQELLDELMKKPKEEQIEEIFEYINKYHNNEGDLPKLIRELYRQNMVRRLYNLSPKENLINRFEEMLNKPVIYDQTYSYLDKNPDSKVAVELLFMLEDTYQITAEGVWQTLIKYDEENNDEKDIQQEVINRIHNSLEERLGDVRPGEVPLDKLPELTDAVKEKRIEILERIVDIGNYRKNDALFLLAEIYVHDEDMDKVMGYLKQINPKGDKDFMYEKYYQEAISLGVNDMYLAFRQKEADFNELIDTRGKKLLWKD